MDDNQTDELRLLILQEMAALFEQAIYSRHVSDVSEPPDVLKVLETAAYERLDAEKRRQEMGKVKPTIEIAEPVNKIV
jgi:hypothetical protein